MSSQQHKRSSDMSTYVKNQEEVIRTAMAIMQHICSEIDETDVEEVMCIDSAVSAANKYSLAIMVSFVQVSKRDAVLRAAVGKRPLYTDDIPAIKNKMENQKLSIHKRIPKHSPKHLQKRAKRPAGADRTIASSAEED